MAQTNEQAVPQMGQMTSANIFGPFYGKGELIDAWAELVEDAADQADSLSAAFREKVSRRQIPKASVREETLTASGVMVERRRYHIIQRGVATLAVFIATFGNDLYVSWRLFALGQIDVIRIAAWLILSGLVAIPGTYEIALFGGGRFNVGEWFGGTIIWAIILGIIAVVYGALRHREPLALFRAPINEFQQDDLAALAMAVHKSLLHAIDAVGIDTKLIRVKEQFAVVGRRRLI